MATRGHFVFPIDDKNHRVLVIWDLNGYGEYEFDRCIYAAAILDDRKSLSIAFLAISDQYATFFLKFIYQNGRRPPFWKSLLDDRKSLSIAFLAISDQYATFFLFFKWPPAAILKSDLRQNQ